jgi:hypothetical protein
MSRYRKDNSTAVFAAVLAIPFIFMIFVLGNNVGKSNIDRRPGATGFGGEVTGPQELICNGRVVMRDDYYIDYDARLRMYTADGATKYAAGSRYPVNDGDKCELRPFK